MLPQVAIRMVQERPLISTEKMDSPKAAIHVMSEFLSQMDRDSDISNKIRECFK